MPVDILRAFAVSGQFIFILEALAQCLPLWVFWPVLRGPYWSLVVNNSAGGSLIKGYSSNAEANVLISLFWATAVAKAAEPWFERVPSAANVSDAISRKDFSKAKEMGWTPCEVGLDCLWQLLREAKKIPLKELPAMAAKLCTSSRIRGLQPVPSIGGVCRGDVVGEDSAHETKQ